MSEPLTKVIFRVWPREGGGGVIAIFPEVLGDFSPYTCSSYEHVGQHAACDPFELMAKTRPATEQESADLAEELRRAGYRLQPVKRLQASFLEHRKAALAECRKK